MNLAQEPLHERIRQGDKEAFEIVFRAYYPPLCTYASRITGSPEVAEDIVQTLFFQIWLKRESLIITQSLKSYLFRSVRNSCMNHFKRAKIIRMHEEHARTQEPGFEPGHSDSLEVDEVHTRLRATIDSLPPERRKVFMMIKLEGRKYREVADLLGISVKTVENQMGKALQHIRQAMQGFLPLLWLPVLYFSLFMLSQIGVFVLLIV